MWPFPSITNQLLTITCTPQELTCSLIRPTKIADRYEVYAYHNYPFTHGECEQMLLCNPTLLRSYIQEIITRYQLEQSLCMVSLNGPSISERIITLTQATPSYQQIIDPRLKGYMWDLCYLYPEDNSLWTFYVAGIKQALLLQCTLLFLTLPIHLIGITTESMALVHLYKKLYGPAFRPTQLALDMKKLKNTSLHELISNEYMRRSLTISTVVPHESPVLRTALGLFLLGHTADETN